MNDQDIQKLIKTINTTERPCIRISSTYLHAIFNSYSNAKAELKDNLIIIYSDGSNVLISIEHIVKIEYKNANIYIDTK